MILTEMEKVTHTFEPVYDKNSKILILGTFPSVKSREENFYYGHKQNRFWKVTAALSGSEVPETVDQKKEMLLANHIAIWDVIASCSIEGSSDSSIKDVTPNDIGRIVKEVPGIRIFANGGKAWELYEKYCRKETGRPIEKLPSTSPANAAWSLPRLVEEWKRKIYGTDEI